MHPRNVTARARARLQLEMPISGDEDLLKLQDQAVEYISEAKRGDPSGPNELVSSVIDAVRAITLDTSSENNDGALANPEGPRSVKAHSDHPARRRTFATRSHRRSRLSRDRQCD
jgi:hypothetical protein